MTKAITKTAIPPTTPAVISEIGKLETFLRTLEQCKVRTEHVFHAGVYARTVRVGAGVVFTSAVMKRATLVIVSGTCKILCGDKFKMLRGYTVLPASAGRKQVFMTIGPVEVTMVFATDAKTVDEAEKEFTDDTEMLSSHNSDDDLVTITGE